MKIALTPRRVPRAVGPRDESAARESSSLWETVKEELSGDR